MTWVDWIVIAFLIFGIVQGFWRGFFYQLFQMVGALAALLLAFWLFPKVGGLIETNFRLPITFARPLSLAVLFFIFAGVFQFGAVILQKLVAPVLHANPANRALGALFGFLREGFIASILITIALTLPLSEPIKAAINDSRFSKPMVHFALATERAFGRWFNNDSLKSLSYRIIGTDESTTTSLNYTVENPEPDFASEAKLLLLTNEYRQREKKPLLKPNEKLREVARAHARDMLTKGYFSHISPQGEDAADRVKSHTIAVLLVGENLASAPNVEIAHVGLLASPGHKRNIINEEFNEVGIGVLDAGKHGKMVVEVFAKTF